MPAPSPISEKTDLVNYSIFINGAEIDGTYQVLSVIVEKDVNRIPYAKLTILDGSSADEDFPISDSADFVPGNKIRIDAGYHASLNTIFSGIIIKHAISIRSGKASELLVECRDQAISMTIGRKNLYFGLSGTTTDSDVISQIIGSYSLSSSVQSTSSQLTGLVQYYATDWDFIVSRADVNGQVVLVDQGKVTVTKPDTSQAPVLTIQYGDSVMKLDAEVDARTQFASVQCSSWDIKSQDIVQVTSQDPGLTLPGNFSSSSLAKVAGPSEFQLQSGAAIAQQSLQDWANAQITKSAMAKVRGAVKFQGSSLVNPGVLVALGGLGDRFNGNAYVSGVRHELNEGNWITEARIGLSAEWFAETGSNIIAPPAGGLLPGIQGLQVGIVQQIDSDPDGEYRVKVKIPVIDDSDGLWARLGNMYATSNAGSFFFPEVNDEVLLGFINDDPRFPVILGSLYSSTHTPPFTPDNKNTNKAIVTNSQLKIVFDDVKKVTQILTPANNSIVLSDDAKSITITDQNSNSITMSSSGITINSASAIALKASTDITLTANGNITLSATQDAKISGLNVSAAAQVKASVQGSASAELTASGQVSVKGAIVMIN